jgi:hypothetical protein
MSLTNSYVIRTGRISKAHLFAMIVAGIEFGRITMQIVLAALRSTSDSATRLC